MILARGKAARRIVSQATAASVVWALCSDDAGDHRPGRDLPDLLEQLSDPVADRNAEQVEDEDQGRDRRTTQIAMRVSLATRASLSASPASQVLIGRNYPGEQSDRMSVMLEGKKWRRGVDGELRPDSRSCSGPRRCSWPSTSWSSSSLAA